MTNEATVTNLDDERLIREGEAAAKQNSAARVVRVRNALNEWRTASDQWIEKTLALAAELCAARKDCDNDDRRFGAWLLENSCDDLGRNARAAFIKIGQHLDLTRRVLESTKRRSIEHIWDEEVRPLIYQQRADTSTNPPPTPQPPPQSTTVAKTDEPPKNTLTQKAPKLTRSSGLFNVPRGDELASLFQSAKARATLSHVWHGRGGKQIWELITKALDGGLITPNNQACVRPNLLLLFPGAPPGIARQFDLTNQKERTRINDTLLPNMIACRDKLLADPSRLKEILANHEREQRTQQQARAVAQKRSAAVAVMPAAEQELMMFGQTVWPRVDINQGEYDYDQIRAAIWTFRDFEAWNVLAKENTESLARRIRNSLRYLGEYLQRTERDNRMAKIFTLMIWFSHLMEKNPKGECKWPHYPHVEGQW